MAKSDRGKKTKAKKKDNASIFDYTLVLKPDGTVKVYDDSDGEMKLIKPSKRKCPPIKKVLNVRKLTIVEAKGSRWAYIDPPGYWWMV
ncbi:MAG: hypothetical protein AB2551_01200 [Candidatus Thiodiazotropha sp.]